MSDEIKTGIIKRMFFKKGFGFITDSETNEDIFFHATGCVDPKYDDLQEGMQVNYTETESKDGRTKAIEIVAI
jgi:CspA family cold shock protein